MPDNNPTTESSLEHLYCTAEFLARSGDYDLAIALLRKGLIRLRVDKEVGRAADPAADAGLAAAEQRLEHRYSAFRAQYDEVRRPWVQTLWKTATIAGIVAVTFLICFSIAMARLDALIASPVTQVTQILDGAVKAQVPRLTDSVLAVVPQVSAQMNKEMQNVSVRFSAYLEQRVDAALDERIGAIVDEKLKARAAERK